MKTIYRKQNQTVSRNTLRYINGLSALIILSILPIIGISSIPTIKGTEANSLVLEINMVTSDSTTNQYLKDTLSISILETTTGDEYVLNTITGSISIPLLTDKHYFIYMSKTGSVSQSIEFQTAGSEYSHLRTFYVDYYPVNLDTIENGLFANPMSVVKFDNDEFGTVKINSIGVNILCEE